MTEFLIALLQGAMATWATRSRNRSSRLYSLLATVTATTAFLLTFPHVNLVSMTWTETGVWVTGVALGVELARAASVRIEQLLDLKP